MLKEVGVRLTGLVSASLRLGLAVRNPGRCTVVIYRIEYGGMPGGRPLVNGQP